MMYNSADNDFVAKVMAALKEQHVHLSIVLNAAPWPLYSINVYEMMVKLMVRYQRNNIK